MSYSSEVLADSPWGYWKCDETSGTTLADSSGNSRPMSIIGTPTLAQTGPGGTADAIAWPSSVGSEHYALTSANFGTSPATYEAWVYLTGTPATQTPILACGLSYGVGGTDKYLYVHTDGTVRWYIFNSGQVTAISSGALTLNAWNQVIASTGAAGTKIRINKTTVGTVVNTGTTSGTPKLFIHGGGIDGTGGNTIDATNGAAVTIAEVSAYTAQLSDARTDAHYDAMLATTASGSITLSGSAGSTAAAAATASLTLSGSAVTGDIATGTGSLTLSGSAAAAGGATATGSLSLSGSVAAAGAAAATGHLELTGVAEASVLYGTDTTNGFFGARCEALGVVTLLVPVTPPPTVRVARVDKAIALPDPVLVKGRPT